MYSSMMVLDKLLNNRDLASLTEENIIYSVYVRQVDEEVWDTFFIKIDNDVKLLNSMGKTRRKCYADIPKEILYNIDKMATKTSKCCQKIESKHNLGCIFYITSDNSGCIAL